MRNHTRSLVLFLGFMCLFAQALSAAPITINALGDTILQDNDNNGNADAPLFGLGGGSGSAGSFGAFTQANKPSQGFFVTDSDAIRFNLSPLVGELITSATLRLVQRDDFRGLQAGTESVFGFTDDATPELDDYIGGTPLGIITAPGVVGAVVTLDVTSFVQNALTVFGPGNDFAVFRLQDPVTSDTTSNPFSLSFSNDRTPDGPPLQLIVDTAVATVPEPGTLLLLGSGLAGLACRKRLRRKTSGASSN